MSERSRKMITAAVLAIFTIGFLSYFDGVLKPSYWYKSLVKGALFSTVVLLYCRIFQDDLIRVLHIRKKLPSGKLLIFMFLVYAGIICAYLILKDQIDLSGIRESLLNKEGLTKKNFPFIFSYIIIVNSFLEEGFFRGFLYHAFADNGRKVTGMLVSSFLFAIYHLGIVATWFHPLILLLCIAGLMGAGIFLQLICEREDNLLASWIVHGFANLAINTIGVFMLFM